MRQVRLISISSGQADEFPNATFNSSAIKFLKHRLKEIPLAERDSLTAELFAEIRKPIGSLGRVSLGRCIGERSLPEFYKNAETAWNMLDHECDDQKVKIPGVIDPINPG